MPRLFHAYLPTRVAVLAASEAAFICLAMAAAIFLEFGADSELILFYEHGLMKIGLVCVVCLICMYYFDLYDSLVMTSAREVLTRLVQVLGATCLLLAVVYYLFPQSRIGTRLFIPGLVFTGLALAGGRKLFFALNRLPQLSERVLVLGDGGAAASLVAEMEKRPELGMRLRGFVSSAPGKASLNGQRYLGGLQEISSVVEQERIHRIIVALSDRRGNLPMDALLDLKKRGVIIQDGTELYETITGKAFLEALRPSWLLYSPGFSVSGPLLLYKRALSFTLSAAGLLATLPLTTLIALAIRLDSAGPLIFRQTRIGKDGRPFTLYKFRTMRNDVDQEAEYQPAEEDDRRFTRVGRWLRRTRLDELPQLFNILRGDMCFVGPRPFVPNQEEECVGRIPFYWQRWSVKPGATGWAQVNRGYCATLEDNTEKLAYDLFYVKNMSIGLDLLILFKTAKILLLGRGGR